MKKNIIFVLGIFSCLTFSCVAQQGVATREQPRERHNVVGGEGPPTPSLSDMLDKAREYYVLLPNAGKLLIKATLLAGVGIVIYRYRNDLFRSGKSMLHSGYELLRLTGYVGEAMSEAVLNNPFLLSRPAPIPRLPVYNGDGRVGFLGVDGRIYPHPFN